MSMFCYQCQETAMGTGCTLKGVCGKTSEVANLQDLLLFVVRGIAVYNEHLRQEGHPSEEADKFIYDALFVTITNANFDKAAIIRKIKEGLQLKNELASKVTIANAPDECLWDGNEDEFEEKARTVGVLRTPDEDIRSLKELVHYGLKGMAAYVEHAHNLGYQSRKSSPLCKVHWPSSPAMILRWKNWFSLLWQQASTEFPPWHNWMPPIQTATEIRKYRK